MEGLPGVSFSLPTQNDKFVWQWNPRDSWNYLYSAECLWQATVRFRSGFFFIVDAKRQIWLTARNWSLVFDPQKLIFSISFEYKTTYRSPSSYFLPLLWSWKIRNRISQLLPFDHATWQHPGENPRHVRGSARIFVVRMAQLFVLKIEKLSYTVGAREPYSPRSR